jgi:cobyrinic acid a,c-diamide synthase
MIPSKGIIISAPGSASGKTTITVGLLRALKRSGHSFQSAKSGPDYIDPRFHAAASGAECFNLDAWAMAPDRIRILANTSSPLIIEGAMGLFDGAPPRGKGSTADLARILGLPVVLVLDVASQAQSVAAVALGFAKLAPDIKIAGLILNKVGSPRHDKMLRTALAPLKTPILGSVFRQADLETPSRHLGLIQAQELNELDAFLNTAADLVENAVDIEQLIALMETKATTTSSASALPPPAQTIAIANDDAFSFAYPHLLADWRSMGAEISFFSPLANEAPKISDLVFLPGGYPELHAGKLAAAETFKSAMKSAAMVYGECGGYMTMGEGLIDANGTRHEMIGLLSLETSFAQRKLHLGYRNLIPNALWSTPLTGHEFHYATTLRANGKPLFQATDAEGNALAEMGLINGTALGSFAHVIDRLTHDNK